MNYRSAQVKAAVKVNGEKLLFNWQMGRDLVQKKAEERWGAGVVEQVSLDLRREFPDEDGFSAPNLRYMKQWYQYYTTEAAKLQRPVAELKEEKLQRLIGELQSSINQEIYYTLFVKVEPHVFSCRAFTRLFLTSSYTLFCAKIQIFSTINKCKKENGKKINSVYI